LAFKAQWRDQLSEKWSASFGPSLTYSSEDWTEDMFGISPSESARSVKWTPKFGQVPKL